MARSEIGRLRSILPAALMALMACGGAQPTPDALASHVELPDHAPRAARAFPRERTPAWHANRYVLDLDAKVALSGRRATITWTLSVRALKGDRSVDLYLDLPLDAAIDQLSLDVREGVLSQGRVAPSLSAQRVYERVTAQRIDPALLAQVDERRYRLRVFPLDRPRRVRFRYHTVLPATTDGLLLQIPQPQVARKGRIQANRLRVEVTDATGRTHLSHKPVLRLPYDGPRAEFASDGRGQISQWQFVPMPHQPAGPAPPVVDALDAGSEALPSASRAASVVRLIGRPAIEILKGSARSSKSTLSVHRLHMRGASDLVALLQAAVPHARAANAPILLSTPGHDRWHTVHQIQAAIPADVQVHVRATRGANLSVLAALADAGRGHLVVGKSKAFAEPLITDLRVEVLDGKATWLPLPEVHVPGTPIVLTARHFGPVRARLHGVLNGQAFEIELPAADQPAGDGLTALWHRHQLRVAELTPAHTSSAKARGLVTRSTSLAVLEREQDYIAAQRPQPPMTPAAPQRVVVSDSRITIVDKVYFDSNAARVRARALPIIDEIARISRRFPSLTYAIIGHTDDRERNATALGLRRAIAVRAALLERGVSGRRMTVLTQGARWPLDQNTTADGRQRNRRVEFQIITIHGQTQAPRVATDPPKLSTADRRRLVAALVSVRGAQTQGKSLTALRAELTDQERIVWLHWLYRPAEIDGVLDALELKRQPEWARRVVVALLAKRKDWARLAKIGRDDLALLSHAQRAEVLARGPASVADLCRADWAACAAAIDGVAAIDRARAQDIAKQASFWLPRPSLAVLTLLPAGAFRDAALSNHMARIDLTAADLKRIAGWAKALGMPEFRCRVLRKWATLAPAAGGMAVTDQACQAAPRAITPR